MIPWPVVRAAMLAEDIALEDIERVQARLSQGTYGVPRPDADTLPSPGPAMATPFDPYPIEPRLPDLDFGPEDFGGSDYMTHEEEQEYLARHKRG